MDVTELPIVTEASEVHPMNVPFPINVTESGMAIDVSEVQSENA